MSRGTLERKIQSPSIFLCLWADMWSGQKRQNETRSKSAEYWKFPGCLQKNPTYLMTVLFWHGPVSLSLPSDWKLWECRCLALSGHFCCGCACSLALSRPLIPSAFFRVWVMVWVNPNYRSNMWRTSESGNPSLIVHSSLKGGPGSLPRKLPIF